MRPPSGAGLAELLEESEDRASYRGRYFTTFALFARKPAPLDPA
jgi:hypothetical protein